MSRLHFLLLLNLSLLLLTGVSSAKSDLEDFGNLPSFLQSSKLEKPLKNIIIEDNLGGATFLTTIMHEIGNVLGLGDISPRQDIRSIQEDPFQEDFVGSSLWEFDVQMIKQIYDESLNPINLNILFLS